MGVTRRQARRQQTGGGHHQRRPNANNASEPAPKKGAEWHDTGHAKSKRPFIFPRSSLGVIACRIVQAKTVTAAAPALNAK